MDTDTLSNHQRIKALIQEFGGGSTLTIPRTFVHLTGDLKAALLLQQIVFWSDKSKRTDGYFYKTYAEWKEEIGLSKKEVSAAVAKLRRWVTVTVKRANGAPTCHYRLDLDALAADIVAAAEAPKAEAQQAAPENVKRENRKLPKEKFESDQRSQSESNKRGNLKQKITRREPDNNSSSSPTSISLREVDQPNTPAAVIDFSSIESFTARERCLKSAGIGEPKRSQLLKDPLLSLDYLRAKVEAWAETGKGVGLLIRLLEQHEPIATHYLSYPVDDPEQLARDLEFKRQREAMHALADQS